MSGWTPEWQQDARDLLAGEVTVDDLTDRAGARPRSGATYERNTVVDTPHPYEPENPMLFGRADMADVSTCTDLTIQPDVIWDVNGYYRAIGVPFPHRPVSKRSLVTAHRAAGGLDERWKTYALQQLLDPVTRADYDSTPLGQPYLDDYWNEWLHNEATKAAFRRVANGELTMEDVDEGAAEKIVRDEWKIALAGDDPSPPERRPPTARLSWSYYLWRCSYRATLQCQPRLDTWRTLLVEAFRDRAMSLKFRVGIMGKQPHPWTRIEWDGHLILFLSKDQEPTKEYAAQAAKFTQRELGGHTDTVTVTKEISHGIA